MENTHKQRYESMMNSIVTLVPFYLSRCAKNSLMNKIKAQVCDHIMYGESSNDETFIDELLKVVRLDINTIMYGDVYEYDDNKYEQRLTNILRCLINNTLDSDKTYEQEIFPQYTIVNSPDISNKTDDTKDISNKTDDTKDISNELIDFSAFSEVFDSYMSEFNKINNVSEYVSEYTFLQNAVKIIPEKVMVIERRFMRFKQLATYLHEKITCDDKDVIYLCENIIMEKVKEYVDTHQESTLEENQQFIVETTKILSDIEKEQYKTKLTNKLHQLLHDKIFAIEADVPLWNNAIDEQVSNYISTRQITKEHNMTNTNTKSNFGVLTDDILVGIISTIEKYVNDMKYFKKHTELHNKIIDKYYDVETVRLKELFPAQGVQGYNLWHHISSTKVCEYLKMNEQNHVEPDDEMNQKFIDEVTKVIIIEWSERWCYERKLKRDDYLASTKDMNKDELNTYINAIEAPIWAEKFK